MTGIGYSWQHYVGRLIVDYNKGLLDSTDRYGVLVI